MATQAQSYETFEAAAEWEMAMPRRERMPRAEPCRLRPVPNEDIYLYRKAIDNAGVVRLADPRVRARCWRMIAATTAGTMMLVAVLWPGVYGMLTGYQIETLKVQQQRLLAERSALELEEAQLLDPARLEEVAQSRQFINPLPDQIEYLSPQADGSLASNVPAK
jgi:hypothetical protein